MHKRAWGLVATLLVALPGAGISLGASWAGAAEGAQVAMDDSDNDAMKWRFDPAEVTVTAGSTVVWQNKGQQPHTATASDKSFDSPSMSNGDTFEYTFATAGEFAYYCKPHPWMKAKVKVLPGAAPAPSTPPPAAPDTTPTTTAAPAPAPASAAAATTTTTAGATTTTTTTTTAGPTTTTTTAAAAAGETTTTTTGAAAAAPETAADAAPEAEASVAADTGTADDEEAVDTKAVAATGPVGPGRDAAAIAFGLLASAAVAAVALKLLFAKTG